LSLLLLRLTFDVRLTKGVKKGKERLKFKENGMKTLDWRESKRPKQKKKWPIRVRSLPKMMYSWEYTSSWMGEALWKEMRPVKRSCESEWVSLDGLGPPYRHILRGKSLGSPHSPQLCLFFPLSSLYIVGMSVFLWECGLIQEKSPFLLILTFPLDAPTNLPFFLFRIPSCFLFNNEFWNEACV
jgi:hypothetical protein